MFIVAAVFAAVCLQSCVELDTKAKADVKTLDATNITLDEYTFNAEVQYKASNSAYGEVGVFYGYTPNVSVDNKKFTSAPKGLADGRNSYTDTEKKYLDTGFGIKS